MAFTIRNLSKSAKQGLQMLLDKSCINSNSKAVDYALSRVLEREKDKETIKMLLEQNQITETRLLIVRKALREIEEQTKKELKSFSIKKEAI